MSKLSIFLVLGCAVILCSCVSTKGGGKRFDPWEAAIRADDDLGKAIQDMGYPATRRGDFSAFN